VTALYGAAIALVILGAIAILVARRARNPALSLLGFALIVGGPGIWLLWLAYGGIVKHFGLDSVKGLGVNVAVFVGAGAVVGIVIGLFQRGRKSGM